MEQALLNVCQIFTGEINKLESRKQGSSAHITISVMGPGRYDSEKRVKVELSCQFYDGLTHQTIKASNLGALMDEVYRRAGFADRQAFEIDKVEASLVALPEPQDI